MDYLDTLIQRMQKKLTAKVNLKANSNKIIIKHENFTNAIYLPLVNIINVNYTGSEQLIKIKDLQLNLKQQHGKHYTKSVLIPCLSYLGYNVTKKGINIKHI